MLITRENDAGAANTDLASHLVNLHILEYLYSHRKSVLTLV